MLLRIKWIGLAVFLMSITSQLLLGGDGGEGGPVQRALSVVNQSSMPKVKINILSQSGEREATLSPVLFDMQVYRDEVDYELKVMNDLQVREIHALLYHRKWVDAGDGAGVGVEARVEFVEGKRSLVVVYCSDSGTIVIDGRAYTSRGEKTVYEEALSLIMADLNSRK